MAVALNNDHVGMLDKRFVDARRPVRNPPSQTPEEAAEGLVPYNPFLETSPLRYIDTNRTVAVVRSIHALPGTLESTTLVVCHGLDFYFTPIAPARTYDRLAPTFSRPLLVGAVAAVTVLLVVSYFLSQRAQLKRRWA